MQHVFVLDAHRRPLMPCRPARARMLLAQGKAAVLRRYPFTLVLHEAKPEAAIARLRLKIDPGSRTTGLALLNDVTGELLWAAEVTHRGQAVREALAQRSAVRRSRRQRKTRYRAPRFQNRRRPEGWLPPSLLSRVQNVLTWVERLGQLCPLGAISYEVVRFDTQLLQNPDICGLEYQHGTLAGMELREYLLLKWGYRCAYCHEQATRWEADHIIPRSRGGSDRPSNLALACRPCNQAKDNQTAEEFGHPEVQAQAKAPLPDAAAVNTTRRALHRRVLALGLPVEAASGGVTKYNRVQRGLPKAHWLDAACVGQSTPRRLEWRDVVPLLITAQGHQWRQLCLMDRFGFPRTQPKQQSRVFGIRTGDLVRAAVPSSSRKAGTYVGRVAVRATGSFNLTTAHGILQGISYRHCQLLQRSDGYSYQQQGARTFLPTP